MPTRRYSKKNMPSKASRRMGMGPYRARRRSAYRSLTPSTVTRSPGGTHTFYRTQFTEDFISSNFLGANVGQLTFSLNNVTKQAELRGLYDQYKINWVKVDFIPKANSYSAVNGTTGAIAQNAPEAGLFATAIDYDGVGTPAISTMQDIANYSTFKWSRGMNVHSRVFKPKPAITVGGVNAGMSPGDLWIDCGQPSVIHYGLWYVCEDSEQVTLKYDVCVKYSLSFRSTR